MLYRSVATVLPLILRTNRARLLTILNYHRIVPERDPMRPLATTAADFQWQMALLANHFNPLSLTDAVELLARDQLPKRAICVVLEDGYADSLNCAWPILRQLQIPATLFVTPAHLGVDRTWQDTVIEVIGRMSRPRVDLGAFGLDKHDISSAGLRQQAAQSIINKMKYLPDNQRAEALAEISGLELESALPSGLMLTEAQLTTLATEGLAIGAHNRVHPILATQTLEQAEQEISAARTTLQQLTGQSIDHFAYSGGRPGIDFKLIHRDLIKEIGFSSALTHQMGAASADSDLWQLPSVAPWNTSPFRFLLKLLTNYRNQF